MGGQSLNRTMTRFFRHDSGTETERLRITLGIIRIKDVKKRLTAAGKQCSTDWSAPGAHRCKVIDLGKIAAFAGFFVGAVVDFNEMFELFDFDKGRFQA